MRKRCPHCMEPIGRKKECPSCGSEMGSLNGNEDELTGTVLNKRYYLGNVWSKSEESKVYLAFDEEVGEKVFIRVFTGDEMADVSPIGKKLLLERFVNYYRSLASISLCRLFPRTREIFSDKNAAYLVTEYFEGQSLKCLIKAGKTVSQGRAFKITKKLINGLEILHSARMIYGAICPENLYILKDGGVLLFGMGSPFFEILDSKSAKVRYYNPNFTAPELFDNKTKRGSYCDVYSISALLYYMLTKEVPPVSFWRSTGENIKGPKRLNREISTSVSKAILNGLNWQVKKRTATTGEFVIQLTAKKVSRSYSYLMVWSRVLYLLHASFGFCERKISSAYGFITQKLSKINLKDKKSIWLRLLAGGVALVIALIVFLCILPNIKQIDDSKTTSSKITWYYGNGNVKKK